MLKLFDAGPSARTPFVSIYGIPGLLCSCVVSYPIVLAVDQTKCLSLPLISSQFVPPLVKLAELPTSSTNSRFGPVIPPVLVLASTQNHL